MPPSVSRTRLTRPPASLAARLCLALLLQLLIQPTFAQPPQPHKYVISVATPADKLASGTLWLYSYSWYGLQKYKLAAIQNGFALLPLDTDRLRQEADPHSDTSAYVVVIQAGEHLWFRTPDIAPDRFWTDFEGAIRLLGRSTELPTGDTQLVLAAPVKRHVTVLYPNGRPNANLDLDVSIYLWDQNHCRIHDGLPLGKFRTNAKGVVEVIVPLVPLYLDGLEYYTSAGIGPAGPAYSNNVGMKIPADVDAVIKVAWDVPEFAVKLRVLTTTGRPRPGVNVYGNWNTNTCGGADRIVQTDGTGTARLDLNATFTGLTLMIGGPYTANDPEGDKNTREVTDTELRELFSKHKLTIRW